MATGGLKSVPRILIPQISVYDPLFGVLTNEDVGINIKTSRPKISEDVLGEMRSYLYVQNPMEKQARIM